MDNEDRTLYTLMDEYGERTTITIEKFVADVLQKNLIDVHAWIQSEYERVAQRKPDLGRRKKGDLVRVLALRYAIGCLERSGELEDL